MPLEQFFIGRIASVTVAGCRKLRKKRNISVPKDKRYSAMKIFL